MPSMLDPEKAVDRSEWKALGKQDVIDHFEKRIKQAAEVCGDYWDNAQENQKFVKGGKAQWDDQDWKERNQSRRPTLTINDTALASNAIAGRETTARYQPDYIGRDEDDNDWAEALREFARKVRERCDAEQEESDKFRDVGIDGIAWLEWRQNMLEGPLGVGKTEVDGIDIWEMCWDTTARKRNLKDRLWDARGRWISYEEFIAMFPDQEEKVKNIVEDNAFLITEDKYKSNRWPWLYVGEGYGNYERKREVFLVDYQWKERKFVYLVDTAEGPRKIDEERFRELLAVAKESEQPAPPYVALPTWVVRRAFIVGRSVFSDEELPYLDFPRQPITAFPYKQQEKTVFYGWVDLIKDPQRFKNLIISMSISILQHLPKGRTYWEPGAVRHPDRFKEEANKPGALIELLPNALNPQYPKIKEERPGQFPAFLDAFMNMADQAVWRPLGLTPETLGQIQDLRRISGTVFHSVQDAISSILSYPFDSLRLYRKLSGRLLIDMMQGHYEWEDVARIIGRARSVQPEVDPQTGEPMIDPETQQPQMRLLLPEKERWEEMAEFDVIVEERPTSASQQREFWEFLTRTDIVGRWVESGLMPVEIVIDSMPSLSEQQKRFWKGRIEEQRRMAEQQMMAEGPRAVEG